MDSELHIAFAALSKRIDDGFAAIEKRLDAGNAVAGELEARTRALEISAAEERVRVRWTIAIAGAMASTPSLLHLAIGALWR